MRATITVRVRPRSGRTQVTSDERGVLIRVRAAPEGGRATAEAGAALAAALGVRAAAVTLRIGGRSRTKVFDVDGLSLEEVTEALHRL
jgi:uncharacterized protein YggU (UPF0235/DUF167 family)